MADVKCSELRVLTEAWRAKAGRIEVKFHEASPNTVKHLKAAFETCAEEVEELVKSAEAKKP